MIDDKKIEEAALGYCAKCSDITNRNVDLDEDKCADLYNGFIDGTKWSINEFLKDLWHPASEQPIEFAEVLAEAKITESINTYLSFKRNDALFKNWEAYSLGANITRWLYIDDLFPKEGDEQ